MIRRALLKLLRTLLVPGWAAREALANQRTVLRGCGPGKQLWHFSHITQDRHLWDYSPGTGWEPPILMQPKEFLARHYEVQSHTASQRP